MEYVLRVQEGQGGLWGFEYEKGHLVVMKEKQGKSYDNSGYDKKGRSQNDEALLALMKGV